MASSIREKKELPNMIWGEMVILNFSGVKFKVSFQNLFLLLFVAGTIVNAMIVIKRGVNGKITYIVSCASLIK